MVAGIEDRRILEDARNDVSGIVTSIASQLQHGMHLYKAPETVRTLYGLPQTDEASEKKCRAYAAAAIRRFFAEKYGVDTVALASTAIVPPLVKKSKKLENGTTVDLWESKMPNYMGGGVGGRPVSVVGPATLEIEVYDNINGKGEPIKENVVYIPLAPTRFGVAEGVSAGLKYIADSGKPIKLKVESISRVTRSPVFKFPTEASAESAANSIGAGVRSHLETEDNGNLFGEIKGLADKLMKGHNGSLEGLHAVTLGPYLWANFVYEMSGDNYGHEAVTAVTREVVREVLLKKLPHAELKMLAGGLDGDLRPATNRYGRMGNIRGRWVTASAEITPETLKKRFGNISPEGLAELNNLKQKGNEILGTHTLAGMGPEIVEGVFYALEPPTSPFLSSTISMETNVKGDSLILNAIFHNMEVGTVREGPLSDIASECRAITGNIDGAGNPIGRNAVRMAARIAAATLAGELNQYAQMATGRLGMEAYRNGKP
ncbi:MAG: hypothetical protein HY362_00345 [Candidatus Aenigmarchaeota archaeon]|nr:hypothetical protein [Candidatus Aenigmarchaeota archaeon]